MKHQYQNNFSKINQSVLDSKIRKTKAKKILAVIQDFLKKNNQKLTNAICLDIGGSAGFSAKLLSPLVKKIYVIDIDKNALDFGKLNNKAPNIIYKISDAMALPFPNNSIDIIVCNQVYEHVPDFNQLVKEIYRVLKPSGLCYFSAGSRLVLVEQHYNLPLLSWFPKKISNFFWFKKTIKKF
jgi:ubiquinone/menaquinone biosynthesis C-methylase UbiE